MALKINYNLGDRGWASVDMHNGREGVNMTVSYLHDTLAEFITAANLLLKAAPDAKVIAMDEPGEHLVGPQTSVDTIQRSRTRFCFCVHRAHPKPPRGITLSVVTPVLGKIRLELYKG